MVDYTPYPLTCGHGSRHTPAPMTSMHTIARCPWPRVPSWKTAAATLTFLLAATLEATAQSNYYGTWYFGDNGGIRFDADTVLPVGGVPISARNGSSIICDRWTGRPLFYTDGLTIWDSTNSVMDNGSGLLGNALAVQGRSQGQMQGSLIVPAPCDSNRYYVFTNDRDHRETIYSESLGLHYSIVDMRLNGGRGAVVEKNVRLLGRPSCRLSATVHANGRDLWIVTQEVTSYAVHAFLLTCAGVDSAVVSPAADHLKNERWKDRYGDGGVLKFSPDGRKMVLTGENGIINPFIDVYRFDPQTGAATDPVHIPGDYYFNFRDVAFSPDGRRMYFRGGYFIYQADVTSHNASINATIQKIYTNPTSAHNGAIELGRDGRIYATWKYDTMITVIARPNELGAACEVRPRSVRYGGRDPWWGLPNIITSPRLGEDPSCRVRAGFEASADTICSGEPLELHERTHGSTGGVRWQFPGGAPAQWEGGSPPPVRYSRPGSYTFTQIAVADRCGHPEYDTLVGNVTVLQSPTVEAGGDRAICGAIPEPVLLPTRATGQDLAWSWSPADGLQCTDCPEPLALPERNTTYHVVVTDPRGCQATDSVTVWRSTRSVPLSIPNAEAIPGDTVFMPVIATAGIDGEMLHALSITAEGAPSAFVFLPDLLDEDRLLSGTVLSGWSVTRRLATVSRVELDLAADDPAGRTILGGDTLVHIPGRVFLGSAAPELSVRLRSDPLECTELLPASGAVELQICGYEQRLINVSAYELSLLRARVKEQRLRVEFSLLWSTEIRLEVCDLTGRCRQLYHGQAPPGPQVREFAFASQGAGYYLVLLHAEGRTYTSVVARE